MPPKRGNLNSSRNTSLNNSISKNASIVNMFKRIESKDSNTVKCEYCKLLIKSCLLNDHVNTKCQVRMKLVENDRRQKEDQEEIVIIKQVIGTGNANKKAKIIETVIKNESTPTKYQLNRENIDFQSTPKKLSTDLRLSIYENEEERSMYIKDEKETPVKNNDSLLAKEPVMPVIEEKIDEEEFAVLIGDSEPFQPDKLVLDCLSDTEEAAPTKINSDNSDGKLSEIQEANIPELTLSAKKRNVARKSTSICKYDHDLKENIELEPSQEISSSDSNNDLLLKLDKAGCFDENSNESIPNTSNENSENPTKPSICYALKNFLNALETVFDDKHFVYLLNEHDLQIVNTFYELNDECKKLYVRLFQRKFRWIQCSNMNYENISSDLTPYLDELKEKGFLKDENSIETYEEIIDLLKLPQLKQLTKQFHIAIAQNSNRRIDYVNAILKHFKTQKGLNFNTKIVQKQISPTNSKYMVYCKNLLGKCYKLDKIRRDVFVRILMLYSLSSTHHIDQNNLDSGQQQLFQILMVNIGKLKFMDYVINLDKKIFENRESFIDYQNALEYEFELIDLIENKEFEKAYEEFDQKLYALKQNILDANTREVDVKLPNYLRKFSANSIYCKILSIYATEILQRMKFYKQANELFEFLLFEQDLYLLDSRHRWIERLAINYETHLKDPYRAMEILKIGLEDKTNVRKAGRLALYQRAVKMSQIKRYAKIDDLSDKLNLICQKEVFVVKEAPIKKIEGSLLQPEIIPGRKTIFVQDSSQSTNNVKNVEICSVEQIALSHYIKNEGYTNGKHAETSSIMTLFGLVFWEILFESSVSCVFIDRFQTVPLDLNTDYFYINRKELIDKKVIEIKENNIDSTFNYVAGIWDKYRGTQCSLVNWDLFENLDELKNLFYCFTNEKLALLCDYIARNYRYCRSGGPDLIIWSVINNDVKFVEVKGPGDKLSFKQIVWLDFLQNVSINCEVCYVKGTCSKRLRECE